MSSLPGKFLRIIKGHPVLPVCMALSFLYAAFPTGVYYWDGVAFAQTIEDSRGLSTTLFHPNHLLYNVVGWFFFKAVAMIHPGVRALFVLQYLNMGLSVLTCFALYRVMVRITQNRNVSAILAFLFGISAAWWRFSVDADAYILVTLLLLATFSRLFPDSAPRPLRISLWHSTAMLIHQLAVFFLPTVVLGLYWQSRSRRHPAPLRTIASYLASTFAITFGAYVLTWSRLHNVRTFQAWLTTHSTDSHFSFDLVSDAVFSMRSFVRLFWGGRLNYLDFYPPAARAVVAGVVLASIAYFLISASRANGIVRPQFLRGMTRTDARLLWLSLSWLMVYSAFLLFWLPQNVFYRLLQLPAIIICLALAAKYVPVRKDPRLRHLIASLACFTLLSNLAFLAWPMSQPRANAPLAFALSLREALARGDTVFYREYNTDNWVIRYFNPSTKWRQNSSESPEQLDAAIGRESEEGGAIWLDTSTILHLERNPAVWKSWLALHIAETGMREMNGGGNRMVFLKVAGDVP